MIEWALLALGGLNLLLLVWLLLRRGASPQEQVQQTAALLTEQTAWLQQQFGHLQAQTCLLYTSPSPRDRQKSRMPSSA